jgi:uncharacterized protein (TIGR03437 family)
LSLNKLICCAATLAILPACVFAAQPSIVSGGVVNAASYAPVITPGAWISIFGSNFASASWTVGTADIVNGTLPTTFGGVSVTINGKPAFVDYVSPAQINVQAPTDTTTGPVQVTVTNAGGTATATAVSSSIMPALFTLGAYAAVVRPGDATIINGTGAAASGYTTAISAQPGDVLEIFANGLGATAPSVEPGTVFTGSYPTASSPTVTIGGTAAPVSYAGLVGAGLYQINITVPSTLAIGTYPVVITQNGVSSPATALLSVTSTTAPGASVTLVSSAASTSAGTPITLTASVTPSSSTGTVTFYEGPVPIGTGTLSSGAATLSTALSPGTHAITAVYGSDSSGTTTNSLAAIVPVSATGSSADCSASTGSAQILCLANTFQSTLSAAQQTSLQYSYTLANVEHWSNLPISIVARNGLRFGDLSSTQLSAAFALIQAALSAEGVERFQEIRGADETIAPVNTMFQWGAANYYIAFYGTPSATTPWMLQVAGHHYALNHTFNGKYTSGSPFFIGTEPAIYTVHATTYAPLDKQRAAMYALNQTLLNNSSAKLSGTFDDVVMGVGQSGIDTNYPQTYPSGTTGRGVLASTLSADQQALIKKAIEAWVSDMDPATATELLSIYEDNTSIANTYVGYSGTGSMVTVGDYIRIDGPRVWVEFVVQSGIAYRNSYHYHSIWRDKVADYGGDFQ